MKCVTMSRLRVVRWVGREVEEREERMEDRERIVEDSRYEITGGLVNRYWYWMMGGATYFVQMAVWLYRRKLL